MIRRFLEETTATVPARHKCHSNKVAGRFAARYPREREREREREIRKSVPRRDGLQSGGPGGKTSRRRIVSRRRPVTCPVRAGIVESASQYRDVNNVAREAEGDDGRDEDLLNDETHGVQLPLQVVAVRRRGRQRERRRRRRRRRGQDHHGHI